jgi:hypothetical protein
MLIQCDASIKAIIRKIDQKHGGQFIQEDIDDETLTINANKLTHLKNLLKEVCPVPHRTNLDLNSHDLGTQGHCARSRRVWFGLISRTKATSALCIINL